MILLLKLAPDRVAADLAEAREAAKEQEEARVGAEPALKLLPPQGLELKVLKLRVLSTNSRLKKSRRVSDSVEDRR